MTENESADRPWRVVVAGDQPSDRAETKAALRRGSGLCGSGRRYTFVECGTAAEAVAAVEAAASGGDPIDCLLLDYRLPDAEAPDVLARLPRVNGADLPAVPVVVLTGSDGGPEGAEQDRAVLEAGAQDFVGEDWLTPVSLLRAVEAAAERHRTVGELQERDRALRESEERYRTLFESVDAGFCVLEVIYDGAGAAVDYRFLETNPAFVEQTGLEGALGRTARELVPGLERHWVERYAAVAETGEPARFEEGSEAMGRLFEVNATRVGGVGSRRVALRFTDVTERRRAEAAVRESEARFRLLAETATDVILTVDQSMTVRYANDAARAVFGYDPDELVGGPLTVVIPDRLREKHTDGSSRYLATRERRLDWSRVEVPGRRKDGSDVPLAISFGEYEAGGERYFTAIIRDETAPLEATRALRESEGRFMRWADAAPAILWTTGPDGTCTFLSGGWYDHTGQTEEAGLGSGWLDAVHPDDHAATERAFRTATAELAPFRIDYRLRRHDGVYRWAIDAGRPRFEADGTFAGFVGSVLDVHDRKQAEVRIALLAETGRLVEQALDPEATLAEIARVAVPGFADWCAVDLVHGDGAFEAVAVAHTDPERARWARELRERHPVDPDAPTGVPHVVRTGEPEVYPDVPDEVLVAVARDEDHLRLLRGVGFSSVAVVPMRAGDRVIGAITFVHSESGRRFEAGDVETAVELGRRAGAAIETGRLYAALGQAEEHLRSALEAGEVGTWRVDLATGLETRGASFNRIYGLPAEPTTLPLDDSYERVHPDDRPAARAAWGAALAGADAYDVERRVVRPDGAVRWVRDRGRVLRDADGTPHHVTGAIVDITARKAAEARDEFLVTLDDAVRPLTDPDDVTETAARLLGEHLGADRCAYAEVEADEDTMEITGDYTRTPEIHSIVGRMRFGDFGAEVLKLMRAGVPFIVDDIDTHEPPVGDKAAYRQTQIQAVACVPLHKGGRFVAAMAAHSATPRHWTLAEVELVQTVASRCWESIERARTTRDLHESEEQFRRAVEEAPTPVIMHAEDGEVLQVSRSWARLTGFSLEDVESFDAWFTRAYGHGADEVRDQVRGLFRGARGPIETEIEVLTRGGERRTWIYSASSPGALRDGRRFVVGMALDVTERERAEEARQESEALVRTIAENSTQALIMMDARGHVTYCNAAWLAMTGYDAEEIRSKPLHDLVHHHYPDGRPYPMAECPIDRALPENFDVRAHEDLFFRKDGAPFPVLCAASPIFEDGRPVSTVLEVRDMTVVREAEAALRESEARFRALSEASPSIVFTYDAAGQWDYVNRRWHEYTGRPEGEGVKGALDDVHPDDREPVARVRAKALASARTFEVEFRLRGGDGAYRWFLARAVPVRGADGAVARWFGTATDIHAQKGAEAELARRVAERTAELERSNGELDQFAYVASHDLKAPLRAIDSLAAWIDEDAGDRLPPESARHLGLLRQRAARMERLLDSLLAYSRVGRKEAAPEPVDAGALVRDVVALVAPPEGYDVRLGGGFPVLETARAPLELVFRNLLGNAIKHHDRPDGRVTVSAETNGPWARFTVADDGPGIPAAYQDRVFGLFQTLRPRDEVEGSGMGLAIVKKTVEGRGGTVALESDGRGATFRFTWPLRAPAP